MKRCEFVVQPNVINLPCWYGAFAFTRTLPVANLNCNLTDGTFVLGGTDVKLPCQTRANFCVDHPRTGQNYDNRDMPELTVYTDARSAVFRARITLSPVLERIGGHRNQHTTRSVRKRYFISLA